MKDLLSGVMALYDVPPIAIRQLTNDDNVITFINYQLKRQETTLDVLFRDYAIIETLMQFVIESMPLHVANDYYIEIKTMTD